MQLEKYLKNNLILIIPSILKTKIIKYLNSLDKMYNIKITTFSEVKKHLLFDYNEQTIYYVMQKLNISYENAKEQIDNMYYLFESTYQNPKINELNNLKNELFEQNLLLKDKYFLPSLKNKEILVYGFDYINRYNLKLIDMLKNYCTVNILNKESNSYKRQIYNFEHLTDEIEFVANDILEKKLDFNHVFIYGINKDNESTIKRIFANYHININLNNSTSLFETKIGQNFLDNLNNYEDYIEQIKNNNFKDSITDIINKYYWASNKLEVKDMLVHELKNTKMRTPKFNNAVNAIDIFDNIINDDDYIYLINFNQEYIPKTYKDEDYINDSEKFEFLETTVEKNIIEKQKWQKVIASIKNLTITSSNQNLNGSLNISPLVTDFNYEVIHKTYKSSSYSHKSNKYSLGLLLDKYQKFGAATPELHNLFVTYPQNNIMTYDNSYSKINLNNFDFSLSYSKMNTYFECPFKYYCDNILNLNKYEETFDTWTGSLCHYILSKIYDEEYDFETAKEEYIPNHPYNLSLENKVFLAKILNELKDAIKFIKSLSSTSKYQTIECEKYIETNIDGIKFNGIIDKVMHYNNNIVLIDYKTGNPNIDLRLADYGLNLQLPTYIFLIKQLYPNSHIVGIYLQHILKPNINKEFGKSESEIYENHLKLTGYSLGNENYLQDFDSTYENSEFIKGLKLTANGFSKNSKVLTDDNFKKLEELTNQKIEECINGIRNAKFDIEPKISGTNNISCSFCQYKSVCFTSEKDKKYVMLDKELTFLGGTND